MNATTRSRVRGAILGTAIGDALGMPVEGLKPETIRRLHGRIRSFKAPKKGSWATKAHNLRRGQWTDDTQLMLAIGESITEKGHIDYDDIARRHILTMKEPRGWGGSTISGISKIKSGVSWWNSAKPDGAGNGTPMKIAPIGVLLGLRKISDFDATTAVVNISRMTHGDPRPAVAGIIQARAIAVGIREGWYGVVRYLSMSISEAASLEATLGRGRSGPQISEQLQKALGDPDVSTLDQVREVVGAKCFVGESYPFTLGGICRHGWEGAEKCLVEIINQGGDADTTGAMAGALMGAACGLSSFPMRWRRGLEEYKRLMLLADTLTDMPPMALGAGSFSRPKIKFNRGGAA